MFQPFYSPTCIGVDYVVSPEDDEYDCVHPNFGMGDLYDVGAEVAGSGASTGVAVASGAITAGTAAITFGISAAITAVTFIIGKFRQRAAQKVATTQIVDEAEPILQQNISAWNSSNKTVSDQAQALANFDAVWSEVVRQCSDRSFGLPGQWCVDDRKRGGKWDWFARYRDPIENDPNVQADPSFVESLLPSQLANIDEKTLMGLVGAGLLIGAMLLGGQK